MKVPSKKGIVEVSDLERNKQYEFPISEKYLRNIFKKKHGINDAMVLANVATSMTQREFAFTFYGNLFNDPNKEKTDFNSLIVVPNVGDQTSVSDPKLTGRETQTKWFRDRIYLPIVDLHTHTEGFAIPSRQDLVSLVEGRHQKPIKINGHTILTENTLLDIIVQDNFRYFFYQFTGDIQAYEKFVIHYDCHFNATKDKTYPDVGNNFAERMEESGAFKALYHQKSIPHWPKKVKKHLPEEVINEVCKKFKYTTKFEIR